MTRKIQRLHSQICTHFEPYRQFFLEQCIAEIVSPNPSFKPILNNKVRSNLNIQRQIMYLKSIVPHDFCQEIIDKQLSSTLQQFQNIRGTITANYKGFLYCCFNTRLMRLKLSEILSKQNNNNSHHNCWRANQTRATQFIDIHESILQLKIKAGRLYLRCSRQVMVVDSHSFTIIDSWKSKSQIIGFFIQQEKAIISNLQKERSILSQTDNNGQLKEFCSMDGIVNSFWNLTNNQLVFCLRNSIGILDRRSKSLQNLYNFNFTHSNRIYSGCSLKNSLWGSQYLITMESCNACVYDIRKCNNPLIYIKHYCEQSPPSVLQMYTGDQANFNSMEMSSMDYLDSFLQILQKKQLKSLIKNPLLIATSPYQAGSSIFAQLSLETSSPSNSSSQSKNNFLNKFQLLFDTGKIYASCYPLSVTPIILQTEIAFFHLDCYDGIYLQLFNKKTNGICSKDKQLLGEQGYKRIPFVRSQGIQKSIDPNQAWFLQDTMQKQLNLPKFDYWQKIIEDEDDLILEQNCYQNRHLRYASLRQFYHKFYQQAANKNVKNILQQESRQNFNHIRLQKSQNLGDNQRTQPFTQRQNNYGRFLVQQELLNQDLQQLSLAWNNQY